MRCLWITRQDPRPADSGELIYTLGLLESLAAQPGIELTVLAHEPAKPCEGGPPVAWQLHGSIPAGRLKSLASPLPADAFRLGNRIQRRALARLLERSWDWIVIDQAACAWALGMIPRDQRIAYLAHNHETEVRRQVAADGGGSLPMRLALRWDSLKYGRMEKRLCQRADLITAITPRDAAAFRGESPGTPVRVLPPGYGGPIPAGPPREISADTPRQVVLAGAFEWLAKRRNLETFLHAAAGPFGQAGIGFEKLHRMPEAHPLAFHHPVNRPATHPTAEAVPQVLGRRHHQAGRVVLVERAPPQPILARLLQLDARRRDQSLDRHLTF
jgi:hypothetical protein